ncbi:helix-turn-helix domain-containing protein [Thalassotalea euphylliae]|uniref:AraC family transcriptional regulator n=1 Tax=Thalassotalea euphylliae TaxID=1655234 RepID=A0A3E0UCD3_9GAMM|nr:AraC family transcriptional regulator [Thalassotalea euphylliae]REL34237.1 AraC family transcriptional regulator [Thalassotalea euphylliae]
MVAGSGVFALNLITLTVIVFSAHLLLLRATKLQAYLPLAVCLISVGVVLSQPVLASLATPWRVSFLILSLPALMLIAPSFWCYVCGITAQSPWQFKQLSKVHFLPFAIAGVVALTALLMPSEIQYQLLVLGDDSLLTSLSTPMQWLVGGTLIVTFLLVIAWVIQSGYYVYQVVGRLHQYRRHLKDLFASTEEKEARWLTWLLLAIGVVWALTAISLLIDNLLFSFHFDGLISGAVTLVMVWSVALWGLRQKPGFEELYTSQMEVEQVLTSSEQQTKYQRSALSSEQANTIATKIEQAMQQDQLYLDSSLSLQKLASHIHTSPNYISQTLNESLGANFFDYVNRHRIEAAKQTLQQSNDTVVDIAMAVGFNAKSSFYTAFKKETQQTPSQYRKSVHVEAAN